MALGIKNLPANAGDVRDTGLILGQKDPLEKAMGTHFSVLAWRIPWTEEPGGLWSKASQRVGHDWSDLACRHAQQGQVYSIVSWLLVKSLLTYCLTISLQMRLPLSFILYFSSFYYFFSSFCLCPRTYLLAVSIFSSLFTLLEALLGLWLALPGWSRFSWG